MYRGRKGSLADFIKATHRKQSISTDFISIKESTKSTFQEKDIENADNNKRNDIETKRRKDDNNISNGVNAESDTNNERSFKNAVDVIRYRMQRSNELRLHLTESKLEGQFAKADDNKALNYDTETKEIKSRQKESNQNPHELDESKVDDVQTATRDTEDQLKEQMRKSDNTVATSTVKKSDTETIKITKSVKGVDTYKEAQSYGQDAKTTSKNIVTTGKEHDIQHEMIRSTEMHSNVSVSTTQDQNLDEVSLWSSRDGEMNSTSGSHKSGSVDETRSSREFLNAINDWKNSKDLQKHVRRNRSQNDERRLQIWLKSKEGREAQQRRRRSISARMRDRKARGYLKRNSVSINGNESGNDVTDSLAKLVNNRENDNTICDNENKIDENVNRETAEKTKESDDIRNKQDTSDSNSDEEQRIERLGRIGSAMTERIIENTIENIESIDDHENSAASGSTRPRDNEGIVATEKTASSYEDEKATSGDSSDEDRNIEKLGRIGSAVTERIITNTMENMQSDGEVSSDIDDTKTKTEHPDDGTATNEENDERSETEKNVNDGKTINFHSSQQRKQQAAINIQPKDQTNKDQLDDQTECVQITSSTEMKAVQQGQPTKDADTEHQTKYNELKNQEKDVQPEIKMNNQTRDDRQWDQSKNVRTNSPKKVIQQENQTTENQLKERKKDIQPGDITKDDRPNKHKDVQPEKEQNDETRVVQLDKQSENIQSGDKPKIPQQIQKKNVKEDGQLKVVISKEHMKNVKPKEDTSEIQQKDQPKDLQPKDLVKDQTKDIQQRYQTIDGHPKDEIKDMQQTDQTTDIQPRYETKDDRHDPAKDLQPKEQMNNVIPKEQVKDLNSKNETIIVQPKDQIKDLQPKEQMKDFQQKEQMKDTQPKEQMKNDQPKEHKNDVHQKDETKDVHPRNQTKDVQQDSKTEDVQLQDQTKYVHLLNVQNTSSGTSIKTSSKGNVSNENTLIHKIEKDVKEKFVSEVHKDTGNSTMDKEQPSGVKNTRSAEIERRISSNSDQESNFIVKRSYIVNAQNFEEKDIENRTNPKDESNNQQDDQGKQQQRGKYSDIVSAHDDEEVRSDRKISISDEDVPDAYHSDSPSLQTDINDKERIVTKSETDRDSEHLPSSNVHQYISSGSPKVPRNDEDEMKFFENRMKENSETTKQIDEEDSNSLKINERISGLVDRDLIRKETAGSEISIPERQNLNSGEDEVEVTCSRESVSVQTDHVNIQYRPSTNNSTSEVSKYGEILSSSQKSQKGETSSKGKRYITDIDNSKDKEQDRHTCPKTKNSSTEAEIRQKDKEQDRHISPETKNSSTEAKIQQKDKEQDRHISPETKNSSTEAEIRQKDKEQDRHTSPEVKNNPTEVEIRQKYEGMSHNENPGMHKTVQLSRDIRAKASPKLSKAKYKDKKTEQVQKEQTEVKSTEKQLKSAKNSPSRRSYVNSPSFLAPSPQRPTKKVRGSSKASMKNSSKDRTFSEDTNDILNKLETIDKQLAKLETHEEYESTDEILKQNPEYQPKMDTSENEMTGNSYPETDESIEIIVRNGSPHRGRHQDDRANDFEVLVRIPSASTDRSENTLPMHQLETPRKSIKITSNDNDIKIVINKRKDGLNNELDSSYRLNKERSFTRLRHVSLKEQEDDDDQIMYFIKHAQAEQRARVDKLIEEIYYIKTNEHYLSEKLSRGQTTVHTWRPMKERSIKMYGDRRNFLYSGSEDSFHSFSKFASYSREVQQFVGFVAPKKQDAPKPAPELVIPSKSRKQRAYGELKKKLKHLY